MKSCSFAAIAVSVLLAAAAPAQAQSHDARVRVINRSNSTVLSIYVSPVYRRSFGERDVLGSRMIEPGESMTVNFNVRDAENSCLLDVRAEGTRGSRWTREMDVCEATTWTLRD